MAKHHHTFAGYDQQDAQEMLLFLLDSLHEDLNKVWPETKKSGIILFSICGGFFHSFISFSFISFIEKLTYNIILVQLQCEFCPVLQKISWFQGAVLPPEIF